MLRQSNAFYNWVANPQLNHWTKRMVRIRLITKDPRNCPDCCKPSLRLTHYQLLESGEKGSPCLKAWYISQSINYTDCQSSENTQSLFSKSVYKFTFFTITTRSQGTQTIEGIISILRFASSG